MIKVDGLNWTAEQVAKHSRDAFVELHMGDAGTYRRHSAERKRIALELVYDMVVPPKPKATKPSKPKPEVPDEE